MHSKQAATTGSSHETWLANQETIFQAWFGRMPLDPALIDHMRRKHQFAASWVALSFGLLGSR
jgi:hypothetical protein